MNESSASKHNLNRREALEGVAAASLGPLATGASRAYRAPQEADPSPSSSSPGRDLIRRENEKPGTCDWLLTNTYIDPDTWWRSPRIEGYCSEASVSAGDTLKVIVSVLKGPL